MLKNSLRNDWFLILLLVALFGVGLTALYSAGGEERFLIQLRRGIIGILLMLALSYLPLPWLKHGGVVAFFFTFLMLIAVLFVGVKINNARRWLDLGFHIQPSELMKILLPIGLAYAYTLLKDLRWWHHLAALAAVSLPILLVLKQPDFGTSVLIALGGFSTVFFAGIRWAWIGGFSLMAVGSLPLLWNFVLKPYQQKRVLTLLDPYQDPLGAGYHTIQSQIAVGSGGLWGKGFNAGSQAQLGFLPERHTDFIFAVYAEEFGLIGSISLLALAPAHHLPLPNYRRQQRRPLLRLRHRRHHHDLLPHLRHQPIHGLRTAADSRHAAPLGQLRRHRPTRHLRRLRRHPRHRPSPTTPRPPMKPPLPLLLLIGGLSLASCHSPPPPEISSIPSPPAVIAPSVTPHRQPPPPPHPPKTAATTSTTDRRSTTA